MKKILLFVVIAFVGCSVPLYYQVHSVKSEQPTSRMAGSLIFEDDNCTVSYNLWAQEGGDAGFWVHNKTDKNLYVDKGSCFFVLNGIAHDYYKNRTYTTMKGGATEYTASIFTPAVSAHAVSSEVSVSVEEEKTVCIPPKTFKRIAEYIVNETVFRNCDLLQYPTDSLTTLRSMSFSQDNSPITFENRISYSVGADGEPVAFLNSFYVSEIVNYKEEDITEWRRDTLCGQVGMYAYKYFNKTAAPDKYYLKYQKVSSR